MMASEYRIEKLRRSVVVVMRDGRRVTGDVFVRSQARLHPGPEEPLDHFNEDVPFFAFARHDSGDVILVAKAEVVLVELPPLSAESLSDVPNLGLDVEIVLVNGSSSTGCLFPETRADRARLLDYLNEYAPHFLAIYAPDRTTIVNRRMISYVKQLS